MVDSIKLNFAGASKAKRKTWIKHLVRDFADAHDLKPDAPIVNRYICTPEGCSELAKWLAASGFIVTYWELKPYIELDNDGRKHTTHVGFGLEFKTNCAKFVHYKLANGEDHEEN